MISVLSLSYLETYLTNFAFTELVENNVLIKLCYHAHERVQYSRYNRIFRMQIEAITYEATNQF